MVQPQEGALQTGLKSRSAPQSAVHALPWPLNEAVSGPRDHPTTYMGSRSRRMIPTRTATAEKGSPPSFPTCRFFGTRTGSAPREDVFTLTPKTLHATEKLDVPADRQRFGQVFVVSTAVAAPVVHVPSGGVFPAGQTRGPYMAQDQEFIGTAYRAST